MQKFRETLSSRFHSEYLGQWRQHSLRNYEVNTLRNEEIVLVEDVTKNGSYWNLKRIIKVTSCRGDQIRLAIIKTDNSWLLRPVQQLFRLEIKNPVLEKSDEIIPIVTSGGRIAKPPKK